MSPSRNPALLFHAFPTFRVGGAQVRFCALANHFGKSFRHVLFAMDGHYDARELLSKEVDAAIAPLAVEKGNWFSNYRRFRKYLEGSEADLLLTYNWGAIEWALANRPQLLRHVHFEDGFGPEEAHGQLRRRVLMRRVALARSMIVVPSRTLERIALDIWKLAPSQVRYIPNGIDCAKFASARALEWPGEGLVIGTVALLRREKNLARLIDAFALVRQKMPCRLLIAGDGPERAALEAHAAALELGADVRFVGYVAQTEKVYAALDIFALSSDTEQMPTSVIEAMAAGLPVAATDVGDVMNMVSVPNRPCVVVCDANALANAMLALLADAKLRGEIGAANRALAREKFDSAAMFATYSGLFSNQ